MTTFTGPSLDPATGRLREKHVPAYLTQASQNSGFVPKWKPTTAYLAGDKVLSPIGDVVSAKVDFTSGAAYDANNWNISATYVPTSDEGRDRLKAINASALRPFYAALADRATNPVDILVIGDSISEGEGSSAVPNRWIQRLLASVRAQFQPAGVTGGRGYVPAWYAFANPAPQPAGFTQAGTVTQSQTYGLGRRSIILGASGSLTITVTCTSFDVIYTKQAAGGTFSVSIDGGAAVNVDSTAGADLGGQKQRFTPTQRGSHTITIGQVSGSPTVEGIMVYDGDETKGVRLWDGAHYGNTSGSFVSSGFWSQGMFPFTASAVVIALGTNDFGTSVSSATYKSNIQTIISSVRGRAAGVPIILVGMYERSGSFAEPWANYIAALRSVADADGNAILVDLTKRMVKGTTTDASGIINADGVHPTSKGHQIIADLLAAAVLDGVRGGVTLDGIVDGNGDLILGNTKFVQFQRKTAGSHAKIFANAADQLDIQGAGGSTRFTNNAYNAIILEMSDSGTFIFNGGPRLNTGNGSPEGAIPAPVGSMYLRKDGGAGTCFYIKESGTGNTGWVPK